MKKRDYKELKKIFSKDDASSLSDKIFPLEYDTMRYLLGTKLIFAKDVKESIQKLTLELFHEIYEHEADNVGWHTQKKCKVSWEELPEKNKETMRRTLKQIKKEIFGSALI